MFSEEGRKQIAEDVKRTEILVESVVDLKATSISFTGDGDMIGTRGADIVSVDPTTGNVTIGDNKFRSNNVNVQESPTFTSGSPRLNNALKQAEEAIENSTLPQNIKDTAIQNLRNKDYSANTVGDGKSSNSITARYCNGKPC